MNRFICYVNRGTRFDNVTIDTEQTEHEFVSALSRGYWPQAHGGIRVNPAAIVYVNPPYEIKG